MDIDLSHVPALEDNIRRHGLKWLTDKLGKYSLFIVQEFHTGYTETILQDLSKRNKALNQPRLREVLVRGRRVDISKETICHRQFGPTYRAPECTTEFDRWIRQIRQAIIYKNVDQRMKLLRWVTSQIAEPGPELIWVTTHSEPIMKSSLSFPAKFWWAIYHVLHPTQFHRKKLLCWSEQFC